MAPRGSGAGETKGTTHDGDNSAPTTLPAPTHWHMLHPSALWSLHKPVGQTQAHPWCQDGGGGRSHVLKLADEAKPSSGLSYSCRGWGHTVSC